MNHLTTHKHKESSYLRAYYLRAYKALHLSRVLYKSTLFMQNKPNFDKGQNKPNPLYKRDLRKVYIPSDSGKTNPKQTQYKPNTNPIQTQFPKNQNELKLLFNKGL